MVTYPLDFQTIFINYMAGSMEIFFLLAIVLFAYMSARLRIPNFAFLMLVGLFTILMARWYPTFYALVIFIVGYFFYFILSRTIKN